MAPHCRRAKKLKASLLIMDYGRGRNHQGSGSQQTQSTPGWLDMPEHHSSSSNQLGMSFPPSDDGNLSSYQSSSPPQYSLGDGRIIPLSQRSSILPGNLPPFSLGHGSHSPSTPPPYSFTYGEHAFYGQLPQNHQSSTQSYSGFLQPFNQNNLLITNPYHNQHLPPHSTHWSLPPPLFPIFPESPLWAFDYITPLESAVRDSFTSSPFIDLPNLQPIVARHEGTAPRQSMPKNYPMPCVICGEIIQGQNLSYVHYWTKHPPHANSVDAWTPKQCLWEGCRSRTKKKVFLTLKSWIVHLKCVHQKGHICPVAGCLAKPFGSQADVTRHRLTMHADPIHCTKVHCQAKKNINLCRKDKLGDHEAMWHGHLMCDVPGCPRRHIDGEDYGFSDRDKLEEHKAKKHRQLNIGNRKS